MNDYTTKKLLFSANEIRNKTKLLDSGIRRISNRHNLLEYVEKIFRELNILESEIRRAQEEKNESGGLYSLKN